MTIKDLRAEAVVVATGNDVERIASANEVIDCIDTYSPLTPEFYPCCGGRTRHEDGCTI